MGIRSQHSKRILGWFNCKHWVDFGHQKAQKLKGGFYETDAIRAGLALGNGNIRPETGTAISNVPAPNNAAHVS